MRHSRDVVIQEKPHCQRVDFVVRLHGSLLQDSRELANPRRRHIGEMHRDWIPGTLVRAGGVRRLSEDALDLDQSVGRVDGNAHEVSGQKVRKNPCSILAVSNS